MRVVMSRVTSRCEERFLALYLDWNFSASGKIVRTDESKPAFLESR